MANMWMIAVVVRCVLIVRKILSAGLSASTRYGLMTDRKIKAAKAIIKQIIKDSENLTILNPEQLKEEILTLETALSRILLNRAVYRYALSAQKVRI